MRTLTTDEKSLVIGALLSCGVSGIGIYELDVALFSASPTGYLASLILGAMLFNAGVSGLCAIGSIWYNYQALV